VIVLYEDKSQRQSALIHWW